ncbi:ABC transporter ATP-binding protein [Paramicrobacterium chengjingii]|uniref:ABC transporter ATP-binding protein n=1 Tax=Paramicrobacterium chengjingii TaxID=2769067 RepID=A0ABX6YH01_9MICO|nr:ABC transporter ATP-binding protein [Microbacterium chengjingii]QPZ38063.1 ABC transporter ATP-binding protein [Microbacterium chengjingii]
MRRPTTKNTAPKTGSLKTVSIPIDGSSLLEVENLTVTFQTVRGPIDVVKDSSFRIEPGKTLGIVGESGSGKSMTSLAIMGLLPDGGATTGRIRFFGHDLLDRSDHEMRRVRGEKIAMIFQDPLSSLNPYYTVGLQISEAYRAHRGGSKRDGRKVAINAMRRVKIADPERRVDHYPHQFSGGMRQRIMIAMALCLEPDLIIADEPTTALDVTVQAQILELMTELQEETGTGMLFITHDLAVVSEVADEVLVMQNGETREHAPVAEIFSNPRSSYTKALLDAVPRITDVVGDIKGVSHE